MTTELEPALAEELDAGEYRNSPDSSCGFAKVFIHGDNDSAMVIDWRTKLVIQRFPDEKRGWTQAEVFAQLVGNSN